MASKLPPAREQLERIEEGLDRLLSFTGGDVSPTVLASTINHIEQLERLCTKEDLVTTVLLPPRPEITTQQSFTTAERQLASLASTRTATGLDLLRLYACWK